MRHQTINSSPTSGSLMASSEAGTGDRGGWLKRSRLTASSLDGTQDEGTSTTAEAAVEAVDQPHAPKSARAAFQGDSAAATALLQELRQLAGSHAQSDATKHGQQVVLVLISILQELRSRGHAPGRNLGLRDLNADIESALSGALRAMSLARHSMTVGDDLALAGKSLAVAEFAMAQTFELIHESNNTLEVQLAQQAGQQQQPQQFVAWQQRHAVVVAAAAAASQLEDTCTSVLRFASC